MSVIKNPHRQNMYQMQKTSTFLQNVFLQAIDQLSDFLVKMIFSLSFSFPLAQLSWGKSMLAIDLKSFFVPIRLIGNQVYQALYNVHPTHHLVFI